MAKQEQTSLPLMEAHDLSIECRDFSSAQSVMSPSKIIIATFNIRYAVGSHLISGSFLRRFGIRRARHRPILVSNNIKQAARALSEGVRMPRVDILALQEADKHTARAGGVHIARELARSLQMIYAHASMNIPRGNQPKSKQWYLDFEEHIATNDTGDTGLATLSRFPIASTTRVDLPWFDCEWRPRLAIESTIKIGKQTLSIYNAHIDPHANIAEQLEQHKAIIARADKAAGPVVLLGDFNTLTIESRLRMRALLESHGYSTPFRNGVATWRAGMIRLQPDWIFVRDAHVERSGVARGLRVSDHWPVWAEIVLDDQGHEKR